MFNIFFCNLVGQIDRKLFEKQVKHQKFRGNIPLHPFLKGFTSLLIQDPAGPPGTDGRTKKALENIFFQNKTAKFEETKPLDPF